MTERWKPVVGFEQIYMVSTLGRLQRIRTGRFLSGSPDHNGYIQVGLTRDHKRHPRTLHRLVLESFVGLRPQGHEANHKDGQKRNNRLSNLEWVTHLENCHHAFTNGLRKPYQGALGESNPHAKLTRREVQHIRASSGRITQNRLAQQYGVSQSAISAIVQRLTWRQV